MPTVRRLLISLLFFAVMLNTSPFAAAQPPKEWVDPATGHRVVRLSEEPGSRSLYFHQYPFSQDGKKMVFTTPRGLAAVDLTTRKVETVHEGAGRVLVTGRKTGDIYYILDGAVHAVDFDTHESRLVAELPQEHRWPFGAEGKEIPLRSRMDSIRMDEARRRNRGWGNITVNCDETLIVGVGHDPDGSAQPKEVPAGQSIGGRLAPRWKSGMPMLMFTIDIETGQKKVIHRSNDWLNHLQCSPTDPDQILFCHEGPWHYVDRTWLIRSDGSQLTQVHQRTMDFEIAGHEFFSQDGKQVLYDLQTPRSLVFWLASYDIETGKRHWYLHKRQEWSVHYNVSPDGTLFSGDGGGPSSVAAQAPGYGQLDEPGNGTWMYLFRPSLVKRTGLPEQAAKQIKAGVLLSERLVDLSNHDYDLEPNGIFTPDGNWLVFRSNMHGKSHVYMVELEKAIHALERPDNRTGADAR
ncbi:oligogalacturonate lyase family protein [Aeoliella sp.]|uniref:oligogalacturonate lyase family protein n=1 Tax=Aeoliella sp. TaxID=2795800 RepID=UPI003CCBDF84